MLEQKGQNSGTCRETSSANERVVETQEEKKTNAKTKANEERIVPKTKETENGNSS